MFQTGVRGDHETTPLVIDGIMYLTTPQNHAYALDVRTGRPLWHYERSLPKELSLCCGPQNRGLAALGDRVFLGTLDAHVIALDSKTGRVRWDARAADADKGYSFTGAPLVVKDKVIVGMAASAASSTRTMHRPVHSRGASTPFLARESPVTTRGRETRGSEAARRRG